MSDTPSGSVPYPRPSEGAQSTVNIPELSEMRYMTKAERDEVDARRFPAGAQSNPLEALPEMTWENLPERYAVNRFETAARDVEVCKCRPACKHIDEYKAARQNVLESLIALHEKTASGTHGTYDRRTQVVVEVSELEELKNYAQQIYGTPHLPMLGLIDRWIRGNE